MASHALLSAEAPARLHFFDRKPPSYHWGALQLFGISALHDAATRADTIGNPVIAFGNVAVDKKAVLTTAYAGYGARGTFLSVAHLKCRKETPVFCSWEQWVGRCRQRPCLSLKAGAKK